MLQYSCGIISLLQYRNSPAAAAKNIKKKLKKDKKCF